MSIPNPYEIEDLQEHEVDWDWRNCYDALERFMNRPENTLTGKGFGVREEYVKYIPRLRQKLRDQLWVSRVGVRDMYEYNSWYTKVLEIKPLSSSKLGRLWDSLWGWK